MVIKTLQVDVMKDAEALLDRYGGTPIRLFEDELIRMGFVQQGGDPATVAMEHTGQGLYLELSLDREGKLHSYKLVPFGELKKKQERFRW
ncbi:hypothetical protein RJ40_02275 [Methanofollis aquaemaris]|uniref:Uncharacterized protein n=1 Tax=Methanofollis aquaemaris TaxID=126734 RepID=A0A8A3S209_9EURY|nr:hypothetical protein [Methanofollis aquaemaris]QSZ66407.1 hypothetical protein RJ40_02275 [Methanofollis aquaemaris]